MNNNQINFDPITGQPINNNAAINQQAFEATSMQQPINNNTAINQQANIEFQTVSNNAEIPNNLSIQHQMQNIPTIEQTKQNFINNTQATTAAQSQEKKDGPNIVFIIILFAIIFAALFFIFPLLIKVL